MNKWYKEAGGTYKKGNTKAFTRNIFIDINEIDKIKKRFNNTDVYVTPYMYNENPQNNSLLYGSFYLDLDLKVSNIEDYNKIKLDTLMVLNLLTSEFKIPLNLINIYFSGNKGFHIVINPIVFGIMPNRELNIHFKLLAKRIKSFTINKTIDTVVYDKVRLMRINNTINSKSGLYKVRVTKRMIEVFTYTQMKLYASKPRYDIKNKRVRYISEAAECYRKYIKEQKEEDEALLKNHQKHTAKKQDGVLPCLMYILEIPVEKGNRNNTAIFLASGLFQSGGTVDEITNVLMEWNENNPNKLSQYEIRSIVSSAYRQHSCNRKYGCTTAKDLGYCLGPLCKLYKGDGTCC